MGFPIRLRLRRASRTRRLAACVAILSGSLCAQTFAATPTLPDPVLDSRVAPYSNVGYLQTWSRQGTGFVAVHRAVAVTAAHLFYNGAGMLVVPDGTMVWTHPRGKNNTTVPDNILLRSHVVYTGSQGYAAMVQTFGQESLPAFNQDIAVAYGYQNLISGEPFQVPDNALARIQSNRRKIIIGYAGSFYQDVLRPSNSPDADLLHETQTDEDRFDSTGSSTPYIRFVIDNGFNTKLVASPGGSGSPLLVSESSTEWRPAGIVVAAVPEFQIGPGEFGGKVGARLLRTEDVEELINPLLPTFNGPPVFTVDLPTTGAAVVGDYVALEVQVDGWGPITFQWLRNNVPLNPQPNSNRLDLYNVAGSDAGTYTVRATNPNGTATSRSHVLTVTTAPVITSHPVSQTVGYGQMTSFSCDFRGEAPFAAQWYHNGAPIAGATSSTYFMHGATFAQEGEYRARITNASGEAWTDPATLSVTMGPGFVGTILLSDSAPDAGETIFLRPERAEDPDTRFQWLFNGTPIPGATDRVLALGRVGPGDFGAYSVRATHPRGEVTSSSYQLSPGSITPVYTDPPLTRRVEAGAVLRLSRQLFASAVISYQWLKDNTPITGATSATLDLGPISAALEGDYTLQAVTLQGNVTSAPITVEINPHDFWSELPLLNTTPAHSGGVANGRVFYFGERWHVHFEAGASPGAVRSSYSPGLSRDLVAGPDDSFAAIVDANFAGKPVSVSFDHGDTWQTMWGAGPAPASLAGGSDRFLAGPITRAASGLPWRYLESADGEHWTTGDTAWTGSTPTEWNTRDLAYGGGRFVASSAEGAIIASSDGASWTVVRPAGTASAVDAFAHNGTRFIGTTGGYTVAVSDDGLSWQVQPVVASAPFAPATIVGGDGWFAALSADQQLGISRDGVGWELVPEDDDYPIGQLVGVGGGHVYAIRGDGVPIVSRPLSPLLLVREPLHAFRVTGTNGQLAVILSGDTSGVTYQWYRGESGDTSSPIPGATQAQLTLPAENGEAAAWVRIVAGTSVRDSSTGYLRNFEPGAFFSETATARVAAWLRSDGQLTWMGRVPASGQLHHLRRATLFAGPTTPLRGNVESKMMTRTSESDSYLRYDDATGVDLRLESSAAFARLDATTRVTGSRTPGYFRGGIPGETAAEAHALCLPDGRVLFGLHTPNRVLTADAVQSASGQVSFDFGGDGQVHLTFNHVTGRLAGTWTRPGSAEPVPVRGVREGTDGGILLANLSGRTWLPGANQVTIGGFVVQGPGQQRVLARGIGPGLVPYGVNDAAQHPIIRLFAGSNLLLENTGWSSDPRVDEIVSVGQSVGAFELDPARDDAALLAEVPQGAYTFHVLDPQGGGTSLGELYLDREFNDQGRLVNISTRGWVDNAGAVVIAGFSITGNAPRQVLLRGIGPTLIDYGVTDAATAVEIELYRGPQLLIRKSGWTQLDVPANFYDSTGEPYMRAAMEAVSAFPLSFDPEGNNGDAALLVWLEPDSYTVIVRNAAGTGGTALAEVYDMPFDAPR